jgi:hypothetical protein
MAALVWVFNCGAHRTTKWLDCKAAGLGLVFREQVVIDTAQVVPLVTDSYREFAHGLYRFISRPFYRPVDPAPDKGTQATTSRINETATDRCSSAGVWTPSTARRTSPNGLD